MAKYKRRADGRYATTLTVCINGEKKKKYICGKTIKEVDDKIANLRSQDLTGRLADDKNITLGEWADVWLTTYKASVSYNSQEMYRRMVKSYIVPQIGCVRLRDVTKHDIQVMLNTVSSAGHIRTAEQLRQTIKQVIAGAQDAGLIVSCNTAGLTIPKRTVTEKRVLSDADIQTILNADMGLKEKCFIELLLYTGIRRGEALALTAEDVSDVVSVTKSLVFMENESIIKNSPKSAAGVRSVPIPEQLKETLEQWQAVNKANKANNNTDIIFPSASGAYMTRSAFRKFWAKIKPHLPEWATPHSFRHTYASKLYAAGVDVKTAQYLLGHSSIKVTLDIYTHLDKANTADRMKNKINEIFKLA